MMARLPARAALLAALALLFADALPTAPPARAATLLHAEEIVSFPSLDGDLTEGGAPTTLSGRILRPAGRGPFPAVVLLHGCGGMYERNGQLTTRHRDWALRLRDQGHLVLLVDSFGPRGVQEVCTLQDRPVLAGRERKRDAWAALAFLERRPDVRRDHIAMMGWSQGAAAVLAAYGDGPGAGYRAAVAFYPGCRTPLANVHWRPQGPVLLLVGGQDDWTPPEPCMELAERGNVRDRVELVLYPDAHHGFDAPRTPVRTRKDVATAAGAEVHIGTNEAARADSLARVAGFLERYLKE